ncbi:glycoside hydrolase family 99-like domain-containing protein [Chryseobacterium sp.]|uniref:glycoside hydrolase family 99-like domain-containing protein n=1 Tax=Chryseobacterium sp. TaxID=1871047 RepID=UPI00391748A6
MNPCLLSSSVKPSDFNDKWWGKGFTEWTKPLFDGHQQPYWLVIWVIMTLKVPEIIEA